jgi:hypothetical protein
VQIEEMLVVASQLATVHVRNGRGSLAASGQRPYAHRAGAIAARKHTCTIFVLRKTLPMMEVVLRGVNANLPCPCRVPYQVLQWPLLMKCIGFAGAIFHSFGNLL